MSNPIVNTLPKYVEENKFELLGKAVLGAKSARLFGLQTGIKTSATINLLNTDVVLQDGKSCGFNASGSQTITQRVIETGMIKINTEWCPKNLLGTYAQYEVKIGAKQGESLPFEEKFVADIVKNVQAKNEKGIWQNDKADGDLYDGFIKIIGDGGAVMDGSSDDILPLIQTAIESIPEGALAEDTAVLLGEDMFLKLVNQLINKNLYHFNGENSDFEMVVPGTAIKVYGLAGLNGSKRMYVARLSNFYIGTDMEGNSEEMKIWYSDDADLFRGKIEYNLGVQVAFPDEIIVYRFS